MSADDNTTDWWRERVQRLADETGEPWYLLLDGFCHNGAARDTASGMSLPHAVPLSQSTPQERAQATEEFKPQCQSQPRPQESVLSAE